MMPFKRPALLFLLALFLGACTLSKTLIFNFAGIRDNRIFPERPVRKSGLPFQFTECGNAWGRSEEARVTTPDNRLRLIDEFLPESHTVAFLVIRNDSLLYENYFGGYDAKEPVPSFSAAKSFISALVGLAIEEGKIGSVNDSLTQYLTELRGKGLEKITLRHLLQMTSGIHAVEQLWNPFSDLAKIYYTPNLRKYISKIKAEDPPGIAFEYRSVNTQLLAAVVERTTGKSIATYLEEKIWSRIGMESDASWSIDSRHSGMEKAFCCLNATARDFAKFGRLYLHKGKWQGEQIIPAGWVEESTRIDAKNGASIQYQYQWWIPGKEGDFCARGLLGQYIYVHPGKNLVIVRLGKNEGGTNWIRIFREIAGMKAQVMVNP